MYRWWCGHEPVKAIPDDNGDITCHLAASRQKGGRTGEPVEQYMTLRGTGSARGQWLFSLRRSVAQRCSVIVEESIGIPLAVVGGPPVEVLIDASALKGHRCAAGEKEANAPKSLAARAARAGRSPAGSATRAVSLLVLEPSDRTLRHDIIDRGLLLGD